MIVYQLAQIGENITVSWSVQTWATVLGGITAVLIVIYRHTRHVDQLLDTLVKSDKDQNRKLAEHDKAIRELQKSNGN